MSLSKRLISTDAAGGGPVVNTDNFSPVIYTGDGGTKSISSLSFAPDFVWVKGRSIDTSHNVFDSVRGATNYIAADLDIAEVAVSNALTSFDSNGWTMGSNPGMNFSSKTYVGWCWKAAASSVTNTTGSRDSTVRANTAAGFSIVSLDKPNLNTDTYGHGLNSAPEMIILKRLASSDDWHVYQKDLGNTVRISLNSNAAKVTGTGVWGSTTPTDSVFTLQNQTGGAHIAYCFHSVAGYQKIGTYNGSGSAGKRVYTDSNGDGTGTGGFQPRFVLIKCTTNGSTEWLIFTSNVVDGSGDPTMIRITNETEFTGDRLQFTSDGFTLSDNDGSRNGTSRTYLYWAIA